jgi:quinol monooxygenase YgiN
MNTASVQFTVSLTINDGQLAAFEALAQQMCEGTQHEPGALAYYFYLSPDRTQCRLIERYADAGAVYAHMTGPVVQQLVPRMLEISTLTNFEVYGEPGADATKVLMAVGAQIYGPWHGFSR